MLKNVLFNFDGRVHAEGTPREVITDENIKTAYGAEGCVYNHPVNDLSIVLLQTNNNKNQDRRCDR